MNRINGCVNGGRWPLLNANVRRGLRIRQRRRLSHLDRMRGSATWEANSSRSSEEGDGFAIVFPSVCPDLNSLEPITHEWAPGLDREISKRNHLAKELGRKEWTLRESRRNSLLFLFSLFSHACRKPKQSCDESGIRHLNSAGRKPPASLEELLSREVGKCFCSVSPSGLPCSLLEVSTVPGHELQSTSFPARGPKRQGCPVPERSWRGRSLGRESFKMMASWAHPWGWWAWIWPPQQALATGWHRTDSNRASGGGLIEPALEPRPTEGWWELASWTQVQCLLKTHWCSP